MLFRLISKSSNLRFIGLIYSQIQPHNPKCISTFPQNPNPTLYFLTKTSNFYSTNRNDDSNGKFSSSSTSHVWNLSSEIEQSTDSIFGDESGALEGFHDSEQMKSKVRSGSESSVVESLDPVKSQGWSSSKSWADESLDSGADGDTIFKGVEEKSDGKSDEWATSDGFEAWSLAVEDKEGEESLFDVDGGNGEGEKGESGLQGLGGLEDEDSVSLKPEEVKQLEEEEKALTAILKGPNHAFGDLIAASGITEDMLDSLMALKNLDGIQGLPPLHEIEDMRYEKSLKKSTRAEIERQKQEEVANARVKQVDEKGRAYGTGRRKCSIARVWIQPGDGKFVVNDKEFDVYFPMLDHRAALLRPFSETKTLGIWDVSCIVKGGGVTGQVGAIRLGISKALQNWAPDLRPPLREAGFLTRDPRVVERKKPGKAKARKSFQWVKR